MRVRLILLLIFLVGSLGLIFLTVPAQKFLLELEKGYSIEKLTYLPGGYEPIPDGDYLNMGTGASQAGLIEVISHNQSYFLTFRQAGNNKDSSSVRDVEIGNQYPLASTSYLSGVAVAVHSSAGGAAYVWFNNNKRYEILTNDPFVTQYEVERLMEGIVPLEVDALKPAKDFLENFKSTN